MFRRLLFSALLALLCTAQPVSAAFIPVCMPRTYTVSYTDAAFIVAGTTATKTLFSLTSSRVKLCGASMDPQIAFADAALSAVSCSLGSATTSPDNSAMYLPALNVMQTTESVSYGGLRGGKDLSVPDSSLAVVLTCKATGANFGSGSATALTAGKLWITVYTSTLPPGQ